MKKQKMFVKQNAPRLTIVVPVYNEVENLPRTARVLEDYMTKRPGLACILFVDDGSRDGSGEALETICAKEGFDFIRFKTNRGLSSAIKAGFDCVTTPLVGYIDADLQTTPEDFDLLLEHIDRYDAVVGYRQKRKDTFGKRLQSKFANWVRRSLIDDGIVDTGCPLKVLRTDMARRLPFFDGMHRFIPALVQLVGGRVEQVPVRHFERIAGTSKFNIFNRSIRPLQDLFAYRWMKSRYIRYEIVETSKEKRPCLAA